MKARLAAQLRRVAQRLDPVVEVVPEPMAAMTLRLYDREGRATDIHWHGPRPPADYWHGTNLDIARHYLKTVERLADGSIVYREP